MKTILILLALFLTLSNCSNKKNNFETTILSDYNIYKVIVR